MPSLAASLSHVLTLRSPSRIRKIFYTTGGSSIDIDWGFTNMSNSINLVLFGKRGGGKSSTGNSILGRDAFETNVDRGDSTTELQSTVLKDGRVLNVIDTPGLHERSFEAVSTSTEIVRCANLAKDGIHAILMVFSHGSGSRFSYAEDAAIEILKTCFGENVLNYVVVVFTNGDYLERCGLSLGRYLSYDMHHTIQEFIDSCNGRIALFDNETCDEDKRARQLECLMHLVDTVIASNCGKPFSDDNFHELKNWKGFSELQRTAWGAKRAFRKIMRDVERLEHEVAVQHGALSKAEVSEEGNVEHEEDISKLKETLEQARRDLKVYRRHAEWHLQHIPLV